MKCFTLNNPISVTAWMLLTSVAAGFALADDDDTLSIALINDSENVFTDYAEERNLGFQLGLEYLSDDDMTFQGFTIELSFATLDSQLWEANVMPDADELPEANVWIAPVQASKAHRVIQYTAELDRLLLVPATPSDQLPVADNDHVFRTFYRWFDVEQALANGMTGEAPLWVSAVNSEVALAAEVQTIPVSPRSSGALAIEELRDLLAVQENSEVVTSWPVVLDWLPLLSQETGLAPEQVFAWLPDLSALTALRDYPGLQGLTYYYYDLPQNETNDWLVRTMLERHDRLPSHYVVAGMASAMALLEGVAAADSVAPEDLQAAMPEMSWQSAQGELTFTRTGETSQPLFPVRLQIQPQLEWARPVMSEQGAVRTQP